MRTIDLKFWNFFFERVSVIFVFQCGAFSSFRQDYIFFNCLCYLVFSAFFLKAIKQINLLQKNKYILIFQDTTFFFTFIAIDAYQNEVLNETDYIISKNSRIQCVRKLDLQSGLELRLEYVHLVKFCRRSCYAWISIQTSRMIWLMVLKKLLELILDTKTPVIHNVQIEASFNLLLNVIRFREWNLLFQRDIQISLIYRDFFFMEYSQNKTLLYSWILRRKNGDTNPIKKKEDR